MTNQPLSAPSEDAPPPFCPECRQPAPRSDIACDTCLAAAVSRLAAIVPEPDPREQEIATLRAALARVEQERDAARAERDAARTALAQTERAAWHAGWDAAVYTDGDRDEAYAAYLAQSSAAAASQAPDGRGAMTCGQPVTIAGVSYACEMPLGHPPTQSHGVPRLAQSSAAAGAGETTE